LYLLFWLSLFPFTTAWMGENHFAAAPTAIYGVVLLMAGVAYVILQATIISAQGADSLLRRAVGMDWKGKASAVAYMVAVAAAYARPSVAQAIYGLVAMLWLVPDRRIERTLAANGEP
jgi:uncharacterized membrane protein